MQYIEKIGYRSPARVRAKLENIEYYPFHQHDDAIELICVLNGRVDIRDSAASYTLRYGDVHIFNRKDAHKITAHIGDDGIPEENIILTVHIDSDYYKQLIPSLEFMYFISDTFEDRNIYTSEMKHLRFHLARLYWEYAGTDGKSSDLKLEEYTKGLLEYLSQQFQNYIYKEDEPWSAHIVRLQSTDQQILKPGGIYRDYTRMYRIVDFVSEHFREKLTLRQIAGQEYLTEEHLSRYIKDTLGLTFTQLVSLTRCEEASRQLSSSAKTVDQIANEVGFSNRKHLATHFRRWYHTTPTQYRREIKKDLSTDSGISLRSFDFEFATLLIKMYLEEA